MSSLDDRSVRLAAFRKASLAEKFEVPLSTFEAYQALRQFLDALFEVTHNATLVMLVTGTLLSRKDGLSEDPAMIHDWMKAVEKVLNDKAIDLFTDQDDEKGG